MLTKLRWRNKSQSEDAISCQFCHSSLALRTPVSYFCHIIFHCCPDQELQEIPPIQLFAAPRQIICKGTLVAKKKKKKICGSPCGCLSLLQKDWWFLLPFSPFRTCVKVFHWKKGNHIPKPGGETFWQHSDPSEPMILERTKETVDINSILSSINLHGYTKRIFSSRFSLKLWVSIFVCFLMIVNSLNLCLYLTRERS